MGELLVGGDYACAQGDTATLEHVAGLLSLCMAEPLRAELGAVIRMCRIEPDHAVDEWLRVRTLVRSALRQPESDSAPH